MIYFWIRSIAAVKSSNRTALLLYSIAGILLVSAFGGGWLLAPSVSTSSAELADKKNVVGIHGEGLIQGTGANGEVHWEYGNAISYFDVDQTSNETFLVTFIKDSNRCGQFSPPCARTGVRFISTDPSPQVIYEWTYPVRNARSSEVHDADLLPSGNILVAGMEYERIFIVKPDIDEIIWQWNASNQYERPADPTRTDWLHINDVDRIGDGRFLVSVRNANQILLVERGAGVVEIINKNSDPKVINNQHNPQWLGNETVLVADSGNDRIVEVQKQGQQWDVIWSVQSAGGVVFDWPRDADRLSNGNTLITDTSNNRIVEINDTVG